MQGDALRSGALGMLYADGMDIEDGPEVVHIQLWADTVAADDTIERRPVAEIVMSRHGFAASLDLAVSKFPSALDRSGSGNLN